MPMLNNIYIQLQNKRSNFPTSRRLSPNPTHIEMKTALKIKIIHSCSKIKQTNRKKKTSLKAHNNRQACKKKKKRQQQQENQTNKQTKGEKKIIQLLTVAPELVTLDCSSLYTCVTGA